MQFDISLLKSDSISKGLSDEQLSDHNLLTHLKNINQNAKNQQYEFINILKNSSLVAPTQSLFDKFSWAKHLLVIGIGGSDLGAKMLSQSLKNNPFPISFIGDSTDPYPYNQLFSQLNPSKTIVNVISKSGSTTETAAAFLLVKQFYQAHQLDWTKHFIFTTDPESGILFNLSQKFQIPTLPIPAKLGGRFSVLSPVALFPALFMGINIKNLLSQASSFSQSLITDNSATNPAWQFALQNYLFAQIHQLHSLVIMPYASRLSLFADWFRQLWAESLGKNDQGILPVKALGPADQHSQLQFYNQGKLLSTFLFLSLKNYQPDQIISNPDISNLSYLDQKNLASIIRSECDATRFSLAANHRPSSHILIDQIDETSIAQLIIFFELSVVYTASLLGVDPFDQPGVEQGKNFMYSLLGRSGYESYQQILEKFS